MNRRALLSSSSIAGHKLAPQKVRRFGTVEDTKAAAEEVGGTPTTWVVVSAAMREGECVRVPPGRDGREYLWMNEAGLARLKAENLELPKAQRMDFNEAHSGQGWGVPVYRIDGRDGERAQMIREAFARHVRGER